MSMNIGGASYASSRFTPPTTQLKVTNLQRSGNGLSEISRQVSQLPLEVRNLIFDPQSLLQRGEGLNLTQPAIEGLREGKRGLSVIEFETANKRPSFLKVKDDSGVYHLFPHPKNHRVNSHNRGTFETIFVPTQKGVKNPTQYKLVMPAKLRDNTLSEQGVIEWLDA